MHDCYKAKIGDNADTEGVRKPTIELCALGEIDEA